MMNERYYCMKCARERGIISCAFDPRTVNYTGSIFYDKLEKFNKHTHPIPAHWNTSPIISIFHNKDYDSYSELMIKTQISGSVEIDRQGRTNLILVTGVGVGVTKFDRGMTLLNDDIAMKVVFPNDPDRIHGFSTGSVAMMHKECSMCGIAILT